MIGTPSLPAGNILASLSRIHNETQRASQKLHGSPMQYLRCNILRGVRKLNFVALSLLSRSAIRRVPSWRSLRLTQCCTRHETTETLFISYPSRRLVGCRIWLALHFSHWTLTFVLLWAVCFDFSVQAQLSVNVLQCRSTLYPAQNLQIHSKVDLPLRSHITPSILIKPVIIVNKYVNIGNGMLMEECDLW